MAGAWFYGFWRTCTAPHDVGPFHSSTSMSFVQGHNWVPPAWCPTPTSSPFSSGHPSHLHQSPRGQWQLGSQTVQGPVDTDIPSNIHWSSALIHEIYILFFLCIILLYIAVAMNIESSHRSHTLYLLISLWMSVVFTATSLPHIAPCTLAIPLGKQSHRKPCGWVTGEDSKALTLQMSALVRKGKKEQTPQYFPPVLSQLVGLTHVENKLLAQDQGSLMCLFYVWHSM